MIDKNKHIDQLISLGLSENEAKAYISLLSKNSMTVGELAKLSGVPRPKLYGILDKLIEKGICIEKVGKIKEYRVIDPEIVAERLVEDYKVQLQEKKLTATKFSNIMHPFYEMNIDKTDPLEYIEIIKNEDQVRKKFFELLDNAQDEILSFNKPPYAVPAEITLPIENKKGRKTYTVYEYSDLMTKEDQEATLASIEPDEEVRIVKELSMKLIIFDRKVSMIALYDPVSLEPSLTAMIVTHPSFAQSMKYVFDSIWEKAIPFEDFVKDNSLLF